MAQSEEDKAKAAAIVGGWTWQIAEGHNYRYRHATRTLTRFYEAASMQPDEVKLVVEYLRDQEIAAGEGISILNRSIDFGEGWKAKDAWYQTAPGERFANTDSTKVRVFQILFQAPEDADADGPYAVENGCAYKSTNEFHWDVEELPTLPASSSGVEYSMRGVTRDRETGLFSCVIEKRERVQQDVAEYLSAQTVFEKRSVEQHLGVKADKVATAGKAASAGDGTLVTRRITKNADCTSDVTNETTEETAVEGAATSTHVSLTGTTTRTVNRNMKDKASDEGLGVGESVENAKTDGGRWNQTIVKVDREKTLDVLDTCQKTAFEHSHGKVTVQGKKPDAVDVDAAADGKVQKKTVRLTEDGSYRVEDETTEETAVAGAATSTHVSLTGTTTRTVNRNMKDKASDEGLGVGESVENAKTDGGRWNQTIVKVDREKTLDVLDTCQKTAFEHSHGKVTVQGKKPDAVDVDAAADGKVQKKTVRLTEDGSYRVEDETTEETAVAGAVVEKRKTVSGVTTTTLDRNQATAAETDGLAVGESVRVEKTPGGLYNNTKTKTEATDATLQTACERSAGVHTDIEVKNEAKASSGDIEKPDANVVKRKSSRLNENGTYDNETRTTTYEKVETTATTNWPLEKIVTTTIHHDTNLKPEAKKGTASASPDDNGAATTTVSEYTATPFQTDWIEWESTTKTPSGTSTYKHGIKIFANLDKETLAKIEMAGSDVRISAHVNKYGLLDGVISYSDLTEWTRDTGSSSSGGWSNGTATAYQFRTDSLGRLWQRTISAPTISFRGTGNEGRESSAAANDVAVPGLTLRARTYATGMPTVGSWEMVK